MQNEIRIYRVKFECGTEIFLVVNLIYRDEGILILFNIARIRYSKV